MRSWAYLCVHVPSGRVFPRSTALLLPRDRPHTLPEFFTLLVAWNRQQPETWLYAPITSPA